MSTAVVFTRLPITIPCPVKIVAGSPGITFGPDNEPIPIAERTEYCALDAEWMIGSQVLCDVHCRELFDRGLVSGTFDSLIVDTFSEFGDYYIERARERMSRDWVDRHRYSQAETDQWEQAHP